MAFNNSEDGREDLTLAVSKNQGRDWQVAAALEQGVSDSESREHEYSYPCFLLFPDAATTVIYTWNKERIRHVLFNRAWLDGQITADGVAS
jgi:predicted neuraminidase